MHPIRSLDSKQDSTEETQSLSFKRLDERATLPTRGSRFSAGLDLYTIESVVIQPKQRAAVRTGLHRHQRPCFLVRSASCGCWARTASQSAAGSRWG